VDAGSEVVISAWRRGGWRRTIRRPESPGSYIPMVYSWIGVVTSLQKLLTDCMRPEVAARFPAGSAEQRGGSHGTSARDSMLVRKRPRIMTATSTRYAERPLGQRKENSPGSMHAQPAQQLRSGPRDRQARMADRHVRSCRDLLNPGLESDMRMAPPHASIPKGCSFLGGPGRLLARV
jgi:hypothetical protein